MIYSTAFAFVPLVIATPNILFILIPFGQQFGYKKTNLNTGNIVVTELDYEKLYYAYKLAFHNLVFELENCETLEDYEWVYKNIKPPTKVTDLGHIDEEFYELKDI